MASAENVDVPQDRRDTLRPMTEREKQQHEDMDWASTAPEVQQHVGKFVLVRKKRILAVGTTDHYALLTEAAARAGCSPYEIVTEVVYPLEVLLDPPWKDPW